MSKTIDITHLAKLINVPVSDDEISMFSSQLGTTLETISLLETLDTSQVEATPQVTNLQNVYRDDVIDKSRMLSQKNALLNARSAYKGFFVVPAVLNET